MNYKLQRNLEDFYSYATERIAYSYEHTGMLFDHPQEAADVFVVIAQNPTFKKVEIKDEFGKYAVIGYFKNAPKDQGCE